MCPLPPVSFIPPIVPFHLLETMHDCALPSEQIALAIAGSYPSYLKRLALAAEAGFVRRMHDNLRLVALWRRRTQPHRWHRLHAAGQAMTSCRHRAREAYELAQRH